MDFKVKSYISTIILYFGILILVVVSILFFKQWCFFKKGKNFEQSKNYIKATDYYTMVIYMHIPFSPFEKLSIQRLLKIADLCEKTKNTRLEMYIYERLRSSIYGTRWLTTPHKKTLNKVEVKLANIKAILLKKDNYPKSTGQIYKELINIMKTDLAPDVFWSSVVVISFFMFVGYSIFLIHVSTDRKTFQYKKMLKFLPGLVIIFVLWALSLYLA